MRCIHPITLAANNKTVPCGTCPPCKQSYAYSWAFRLMQEERDSTSAYFITITYDNNNLCRNDQGFPTLRKSDLQKYFKRLRYYSGDKPIKYYAVGEYGTRTKRPHYHAIIFNATESNIELAWTKSGNPIGNIYYGSVTPYSVGYTLKYLCKDKTVTKWDKDGRQPEFSLMSQGLGKSYLTPQMVSWHKADLLNRRYCVLDGGVKISMPRYYYTKIYTEKENALFQVTSELISQSDFHTQFMAGYTTTKQLLKDSQLLKQRNDAIIRKKQFNLSLQKL